MNSLKEGLPKGAVNGWFLTGDPISIPVNMYPTVIVMLDSQRNGVGPTSQDLVEDTTIIKLVYNKKDDLGASWKQDMTREKIRRIIGQRDPVTHEYLPSTVLGIIRQNYTQGKRFTLQSVSIQYDVVPRPSDVLAEEAWITVVTNEYITINNRQ